MVFPKVKYSWNYSVISSLKISFNRTGVTESPYFPRLVKIVSCSD